jgi:hypothetical protein
LSQFLVLDTLKKMSSSSSSSVSVDDSSITEITPESVWFLCLVVGTGLLSSESAMKPVIGSEYAPTATWRSAMLDNAVAPRSGGSKRIDLTEFNISEAERLDVMTLSHLANMFALRANELADAIDCVVSTLRRCRLRSYDSFTQQSIGGVNTGCGQVVPLFVALALRRVAAAGTRHMRREVSALVFLMAGLNGSWGTPGTLVFGITRDKQTDGARYRNVVNPGTMRKLFDTDLRARNGDLCYHVVLETCDKKDNTHLPSNGTFDPDDPAADGSRQWRMLTSTKHGAHHQFLIRVVGAEGIIVQAYFGYYTIDDWLNFSRPLTVNNNTGEPTLPGWRNPLCERPRFRGVLCLEKLRELAAAIDRISRWDGKAVKDYADITGVTFESVPQICVHVWRLNLPAVAY